MSDRKTRKRKHSTASQKKSNSASKNCLWIRRRRYEIIDDLGVERRPRFLVFDSASKCKRLIMRLPNDPASAQHLRVLRRLPKTGGLPQIIDSQIQDDQCLVVLSWTEGIDLRQYLQRVKSGTVVAPSAYESVRLVKGLIHTLLQLHQNDQLIHGDLKPENLILMRKPAYLAMIDYGSAWQVERTAFREQGDGASLIYAAPELLGKSPTGDSRSDQFSASVILYELLTGVVPYNEIGGQAGLKKFRRHFSSGPVPSSQLSKSMRRLPRGFAKELDQILVKGLQLNPAHRYPHTSDWLQAMKGFSLRLELRQVKNDPSRWHRFVDWLANTLIPVGKS